MARLDEGSVNAVPSDENIDESMQSAMARQFEEAVQRAEFHARELERWQRIARAASAARAQLEQCSPVQTAQGFAEEINGSAKAAVAPY